MDSRAAPRCTADSQPTCSLLIRQPGTVVVMTDREHALPPDSQQPSWPLADASPRHPAGDHESRPPRPTPAPPAPAPRLGAPGAPAAPYGGAPTSSPAHPGPGFAGPYPPGSGPYGQPTSAFQRPDVGH